MDVFILGSSEVVAAFALAGIRGRGVAGRRETLAALDELRGSSDLRLLIVEEESAAGAREELDRWKLDPGAPLVVEVPGFAGPSGEGRSALDVVRRALGIRF